MELLLLGNSCISQDGRGVVADAFDFFQSERFRNERHREVFEFAAATGVGRRTDQKSEKRRTGDRDNALRSGEVHEDTGTVRLKKAVGDLINAELVKSRQCLSNSFGRDSKNTEMMLRHRRCPPAERGGPRLR
jgi:hypothetical protein